MSLLMTAIRCLSYHCVLNFNLCHRSQFAISKPQLDPATTRTAAQIYRNEKKENETKE